MEKHETRPVHLHRAGFVLVASMHGFGRQRGQELFAKGRHFVLMI